MVVVVFTTMLIKSIFNRGRREIKIGTPLMDSVEELLSWCSNEEGDCENNSTPVIESDSDSNSNSGSDSNSEEELLSEEDLLVWLIKEETQAARDMLCFGRRKQPSPLRMFEEK